MIQTGIESRVKIQDIVLNQLPEFVLDESPKTIDFLKQYYISQEYQGGPVDLSDNLDQYLKVDNLKPEVIVDNTLLTSNITSSDTTIQVSSTKGFPSQYGLLKIDEEIITYTGITTNSFTGCIRGFSGISEFNQESINKDLVFSTSTASEHSSNANIQNLSSLFLKEFYKKLKSTFTPGLENIAFADEIDAGNFIKRAKDFYASKGTDEAIKILFKVIFAESPSIINLEDYLIKPSSANYIRREVVVAEVVSGEPLKIVGETLVKTTDESTTASISSVEPFTRKGKTFYIIEFYVSNDGRSSVEGNFVITPNTKLTETASIGDSVINVDSTVSFPESGNLVSGNNTISYTSKSINQFFGCSGILSTIDSTSNVRSNDTYFSYENGDLNKKVEIIILGVIEDLKEKSDNFKTGEGDIITIKNLGDKIKNNGSNWKEIFANSLIYNTSTRYEILDNSSNKLGSIIDRSSLKIGDEVEILTRGSNTVEFSPNPVYIQDIDETQNTLTLENKPNLGANQKYDIRRKLNKTKSSGSNFESNSLISDVLNLYVDNDEYAYVASNSLPSTIRNDFNVNNYRLDVQANIKSISIGSTNNLSNFTNEVYNSFTVSNVPFLTGDEIFYSSEEEPLVGLTTGTYFVEKVSNTNFKLYGSRSLISSGNNLTFTLPSSGIGTHTFTLNSQKDSVLGIQKILRKIPLENNIKLGTGELTVPGTTGILINGVEIQNYKSDDAVYFGPIESAKVLSGGEDFDVINNPKIEVSSGIGTTAKIQPVISGKFEKVYVDSQDYNIDNIVSIEISGGNGKGAVIEPVLVNRPRNVLFNADESTTGGGVNQSTNQISFLTDHNFINGQQVIYNSLGNNPISIGTAGYNFELPDNSSYFVEVTNNKTIKLYYNLDDQQSGNNPVGIFTGSSGSHRFSTVDTKKQVDYVKIIDGGEGYSNRKLIVKSSGISTTENTITFKNHGFNDGELINYNYESSEISGITTANQYYVLKINDDSFRICDAGVGGTITSNYERQNYEKFNSTGSGYQYFSYPEISVSIKYSTIGIGTSTQENKELVTTPVVKGKIVDAYVYESGTGYGSTVLNYEDKPTITIQNGKFAQLTPIVVGDKIASVSVSYEGTEYNSVPELVVSGSGTGAELRAIIDNGRISEVKVINSGIGYSASNTTIQVISSGKNAIIDPQIRKLTVNDNSERFSSGEVLKSGKDKLQYSISKYFESLRNSFLENSGSLSGIIGWAYDGNPIYGPYAYTDPNNISSVLKTLESGYVLDISNVVDRPSGFQGGFFVEDYKFDNSGDLDEYNGRYEKNNEFPNGVYAYHATIDEFPYFIGNKYQSKLISDSNLNQSFDFNNSNLLRNTFPYKVSDINADYDFINETSDVLDQKIEVISVTSGPIESVEIQNSGDNYKVNDKLIFDEEDTSGSGLNVDVKSVKGKNIVDVSTDSVSFSDSIFTWESSNKIKVSIIPNHNLSNLDYVTISGFSTNLSELNGTHRILVSSNPDARCLSTITSSGITTEIYVAPIPEQISVGSSIGIGTETLKVLGIFRNENILRIERESVGTSHTVGTAVSFLSDSFTISKSVEKFNSKVNEKRFFNPRESIGVSTISGVGFSTSFIFGNNSITRSIPSKSIRIENHPFVTNQSVVYTSNGTNISVSTDGLSTFDLPTNLFVINKNPNLIGLKTAVNGNELFFHTNGDDNDQYLLESNYDQILGDVEKNEVTVSVSTSHELQNGDFVTLDIQPNLSVGIGTSTAVRVLYNSEINAILVDPIGFNSTGINTTTNEITVLDHGLKTGDKVFYEDNTFDSWIETSDQIDTTPEDSDPHAIHFKPDGTRMYIVGRGSDEVNEYILSTPWSVSTASFVSTFSISSEGASPRGLYIRDDGLKFWTCDTGNDEIYQYSMSTAWDISTASYDNVSLLIGIGSPLGITQLTPTGIYFKYDGSVLYLIGASGDFIHQFDLSTSWDITTASYSGSTTGRLDINPPDSAPQDLHINSSGTLLYWVGATLDNIHIYELSTPWDISTGTELSRISLGTGTPTLIYVSPDEENLYVIKGSDDIVYRFKRPSPLTGSEYYIFTINNNKFNLCETYIDSQQNPPTVVSFASTGSSSQTISLINPEINLIRNNNLVFDLSDSSLTGYKFKLYEDSEFKNEFVSTGSTNNFIISEVGSPGLSTTSSLTLNYISDISEELYYTIQNNGVNINSDIDVKNYSKIKYIDSKYNNTYSVSGIGTTSFKFNINQKPERLSYGSTECDVIDYSTSSLSASGPVNSLNILSFGSGYKKLPKLKSVTTTNGIDLIVNPKSNLIGSVREKNILNDRFTYSSDKTLRPEANVSPTIELKDFGSIDDILIVNGGEGYVSPPLLTLVNSTTREVIDSGLLKVNLTGSAISSIDVDVEPTGLPDETVEVFATNNTNGVSIIEVESSNTGIFTCTISTPGIGNTFSIQPFNNGDQVFIEGIVKNSAHGTGFNSKDYGFKFFNVSGYDNSGTNDKVTLNISGLTTNTGIANTIQNYSGIIINKNEYPEFKVSQKQSKFFIGESLSSNNVIRDLKVAENNGNDLKVSGTYELSVGENIKGVESGTKATINSLKSNEAVFDVEYSNLKDIGWNSEIGKLSEDYQVIEDNDYYQNLSYSVKSSITYKDQQAPVESLVHTSGLKNFADTGISSSVSAGLDKTNDGFTVIYDLISEKRVDTINNFDNVVDEDIVNSTSKFLKLENVKLTNFTELTNMNVLKIDDISGRFSNSESENTEFLTINEVDDKTYHNYLLRVTNEDGTEIQITDLTILSTGFETVIVENESLQNSNTPYGTFDLDENEFSETFLKFFPDDPFNKNYDVKLIEQTFDEVFSGVGTQPVGFASLTSSTVSENTVTGIGTTTISSFNSNDFESIYVNAQVSNKLTNDMNYVRLYITHDGTDTYMSEYYIDNNLSSSTGDPIGLFTCTNLGSGVFSLVHENDTGNELEIRSNIVGFGATAVGVGTYRFKSSEQLDGQERSVIYQSDFQSTVGVASTTILTLNKLLFNASKSVVQVSIGSSKALHQVMMIFDETDVYTQQLPFLSVDTTNNPLDTLSGIGTFGGEVSGNDLLLKFYPDDQNKQTDIEIFNKSFYSILDTVNDYQDLTYGSVVEKIDEKFYNAINGDRINKTNFELTSNNIPIFSKTFNPNSVSLASTSGLFSIDSHFFMTGEELIYTPDSTIVGVGTSAMMINATDVLPSTVYAIKVSENTFKVAITTSAAQSGTGVTFASLGEGNAHRFTMKEKNTKCIIDVDELVQYPVRFSGITHSLSENLTSNATFAVLSDISSINPTDLLLIDDEYVKVTNVGLGTTSVGPITNSGNVKLVQLDRGVVGSLANTHANSASVSVYRGSFNIVDNEIHFSDAPRGNPQIDKTNSNLDFETSSFGGRVFLKSNYDDNKIYDDISNQFTGIGRTFNLTVGGANTTGIGTDGGSGLVFVNNIYQSPKTDNNPTIFNYEISEGVGITTIEFSGITRPDNILEYVSSDSDINQNETPRGGIIVSFGSTPGLGFAPLVGASVTAVVGAGGSIVSVGLGTTDNLGSGYNGLVSIGVSVFEEGHSGTPAQITATPNVGAGGTLSFNIVSGGTGYNNPQIFVSDPSYDNLPITGVSREGIGSTTETGIGLLMDIIVGGSSTSGIGSTYFEVKEFKFSRPGYGFKRGDVFKPIGIVTDSTLSSPLADFTVTVIDTYSDNFAAWEFGELDYIDSIKNLQDGTRVRFPLNYNGELLSFEAEEGSPIQQNINNILIIFINGVIQEPVKNYIFNGGTSFVFTRAPLPEDDVEIYFYKGVDGTDASSVDNVRPTIKVGDTLQVISNNYIENTITQDERIAFNIAFSDKVETNKYFGQGIDLINPKPVSWTKQKTGRRVNGEFVSKSRDVLEPLIFPTAKIIKDVSATDTEVFIENSELFSYETDNGYNDLSVPCDGLIVNGISTVGYSTGLVEKIAGFSAINGSSGIITGITTSAGSGSNPLAIVFSIIDNGATLSGIETGYPIYIHDTNVGNGVTSINSSDSEIVGIGTTCLDNIYYISDWSSSSLIGNTYVGVITCNVHSDTDITGISTTGSHPSNIVGRYSWGRLSGGTRSSSPISIGVTGNIVSGLSTYPTIQRRGGINIRKTGALPKIES